MKRIIALTSLFVTMSASIYAADITITIPDNKIPRLKASYAVLNDKGVLVEPTNLELRDRVISDIRNFLWSKVIKDEKRKRKEAAAAAQEPYTL